jgi:hypothetical protein
MSNEEPAPEASADHDARPVDPEAGAEATADPADGPVAAGPQTAEEPVREPVETSTTLEVGIERSVRYGPILIGGAVVGALVASLAALFFPIAEDAQYTMGQVVGFVAVLGGAVGLVLGALLALILGLVAKRRKGAAIAVLTDVR